MQISDWVLQSAVEAAARWKRAGGAELKVAINVSARQLVDNNFVERLRTLLEANELPAERIELELTENVLQTGAMTIAALQRLRQLGVGIALDDFGSGYSSMASLEQLPLTRGEARSEPDREHRHERPGCRDGAFSARTVPRSRIADNRRRHRARIAVRHATGHSRRVHSRVLSVASITRAPAARVSARISQPDRTPHDGDATAAHPADRPRSSTSRRGARLCGNVP